MKKFNPFNGAIWCLILIISIIILVTSYKCLANPLETCFTPSEDCTGRIVNEINNCMKRNK